MVLGTPRASRRLISPICSSSLDFRHTAGTRMANAGIAIYEIQSFMEHSTPLVTRKYLDNDFSNKFKAMEILESIDGNEQVHD